MRRNKDTVNRLIFQLVNSLAAFSNMIYLLLFDRNVVTRALESKQNCNGEEYLERIIQVPFEVPMANKSLVNNAFCEMLSDIIFDENNQDKKDYHDISSDKVESLIPEWEQINI